MMSTAGVMVCGECGAVIAPSVAYRTDGRNYYHMGCTRHIEGHRQQVVPPAPLTAEAVTRIAQTVAEPLHHRLNQQAELIQRMCVSMERTVAALERLCNDMALQTDIVQGLLNALRPPPR